MTKFQSYVYITIIVLILLVVVVWGNARKVDLRPATNPQPSRLAEPEASVKYNSDGNVDTSNWLTFRHEIYPYEIRYPAEMEVTTVSVYKDDGSPGEKNGQIIFTSKNNRDGNSFVILADYAGSKTNIDTNFNVEEYVKKQRKEALSLNSGGHMIKKVDNIENVAGSNWQGYQYSFIQGDGTDENDLITTRLFVVHDGVLYEIFYNNTYLVHQAMLNSLHFWD